MRFVIGQGDPRIRHELYAILEAAGLKSGRKRMTDTWTRVATETLITKLDEADEDPDLLYEQVVGKIAAYGARTLPKANAALKAQIGSAPATA